MDLAISIAALAAAGPVVGGIHWQIYCKHEEIALKRTDMLAKFWFDEDGIETIEYALIAALVAAAAIAAWTALGTNLTKFINGLGGKIGGTATS